MEFPPRHLDKDLTETTVDVAAFASPRPEQVAALYRQRRPIIIATAVNATICVAVLGHGPLFPWLMVWWGALMVSIVARYRLSEHYFRDKDRDHHPRRWSRRYIAGTFSSGALWGIGGICFYATDTMPLNVFLAFVLGGMSAGAATTHAAYLPAFFAFVLPTMVPFTARLAVDPRPFSWAMGAMLAMFVAGIAMTARQSHVAFCRALRLQLKNTQLVQRLSEAHDALMGANAELEDRVAQRSAELEAASQARERAERKLQESKKMEALGRLTGGIAHDFNNLLTVVTISLDTVADRVQPDDTDLHRILRRAQEASARGAKLTRSLLAFARKQHLQPDVVDINGITQSFAEDLLQRAFGESLRIETHLSSNLWPCLVDPEKLQTALLNLALNAKDAMPQGGLLTIETSNLALGTGRPSGPGAFASGDYVRLRITDTGEGIPKENLDRVFDPFFTTREIGSGSGLGLSMVYGFVKQSGGHVVISSEESMGTSVELYFPRHVSSPLAANGRVEGDEPFVSGYTSVLVVESEDELREVTVHAVQRMGLRAVEATNGPEALGILSHDHSIRLMVCDVELHGPYDGLETVNKAHLLRSEIKILLTTGYAQELSRTGRLEGLKWPLFNKPYPLADLTSAIYSALDEDITGSTYPSALDA